VNPATLLGKKVNMERSLRLGDRIHGHLVTGHVDSVGLVTESNGSQEAWFLTVECSSKIRGLVWEKGSITLHGVSLTVNKVEGDFVSVCLIPETILRTNLSSLVVGSSIHIEADYFAKAASQHFIAKGMR
jgi:riboflavin synthase